MFSVNGTSAEVLVTTRYIGHTKAGVCQLIVGIGWLKGHITIILGFEGSI